MGCVYSKSKSKISGDDAKFLVLSQLSHDLNSSLCSIILGVDLLLEDECLSTEERVVIGENMRAAYEFILLVSRKTVFYFNEDRNKFKLNAIEIRVMVRKCVTIVKSMTNVQVNYEICDHVPVFTMSDESWIWDIILNLMGNARKFTHEGSIKLYVDYSDNCIVYQIIDTGKGVDASMKDSLFKPFHTGDKYFGTGIGLYTSKLKVTELGGSIGYVPNLGGGSIFWFRVPHKECVSFSQELSSYVAVENINHVISKQLVFLIVDDDIILVRLIKKMLEKYHVEVHTAHYVEEAIEMLKTNSYHAVLSDGIFSNNPHSNGLTVINHVLFVSKKSYVCIISGSSTLFYDKSIEMGIDTYVKPITKDSVREIVHKSIQHHHLDSVLIIDDEPIICKMLMRFCEHAGLRSRSVTNGADGLEVVRKHTFSLVLVDVHMPICDGIEFLKKCDVKPRPYICVISAHAPAIDLKTLKANEFQAKPLRATILMEILERATQHYISTFDEID